MSTQQNIRWRWVVFHWPIFLILSPERTGLDPWPLFALRVATTLALSSLSYTVLETPIRSARALTGGRARLIPIPRRHSTAIPLRPRPRERGDRCHQTAQPRNRWPRWRP